MKQFNGKAIYNPSGKAGEYSYWACNFFVGCSNGCEYCYCKKGILAGAMGQDKPQLKKCFRSEEHALEVFEREMMQNLDSLREHGLFFTFTSDPMLPETHNLTYKACGLAIEQRVPVKVLTKSTYGFHKLNWNCGLSGIVAFGFTLTGHDELEPNASTNAERITMMHDLHNATFKTFASIEPIVDFESSKAMINSTLGFCDLYKVGLMSGKKYDKVEAETFVEWLRELSGSPKIYLKDSLRKLIRYTSEELGDNFVERDYNIFK